MECPVCYSDKASCALVCGHAFCKSCVKTWYYKCDEPSCPMCRRIMYFKGMGKVVHEWDRERIDQKNEEAFSEAFDAIFQVADESEDEDESEDRESGSGSESEWETESESDSESEWFPSPPPPTRVHPHQESSHSSSEEEDLGPVFKYSYSWFVLEEIKELQKEYQRAMKYEVDFDWYLCNMEYMIFDTYKRMYIEDDIFPHEKNLFVSRYPKLKFSHN